ncbi:MAG: hypothetical protein Q9218_006741 [Villophora microphyllina]
MPRLVDGTEEINKWRRKSIILVLILAFTLVVLYYFNPANRSVFSTEFTEMDSDTDKSGIYLLQDAGLVELEFLSLDRFHETSRSDDPGEEDTFCQRMRATGAQWFESEAQVEKPLPLKYEYGKLIGRMQLWLGWSANGGVWVFEIEEYEAARKGIGGRMRNTKDMRERCKVIEMSGGAFFGDRKHCPLTKDMVF